MQFWVFTAKQHHHYNRSSHWSLYREIKNSIYHLCNLYMSCSSSIHPVNRSLQLISSCSSYPVSRSHDIIRINWFCSISPSVPIFTFYCRKNRNSSSPVHCLCLSATACPLCGKLEPDRTPCPLLSIHSGFNSVPHVHVGASTREIYNHCLFC